MGDFTPACQVARDAYQAAYNDYLAARDAYIRAESALSRAVEALNQAQQRLDNAQDALDRANDAWEAHLTAVKSDPTLAVPGVEAGVAPPQTPPDGAAIAGLFRARTPPNFSIWALGDPEPLDAWGDAANRALQKTVTLRAAAQQAGDAVAQRTTERDAAATAEQSARQIEQNARTARSQASATASAALAQVKTACAGQTATYPLDGGEIEVAPGILPEDEKAVRDRLDSLPDEEKEGLNKVDIQDELGPPSPAAAMGVVAGQYRVSSQRIQLFIFGHSEKVVKHELGHHVYFDRLPETARERWRQFYGNGTNKQKVPAGKMPTGYATTDEQEGFAEVYEFLRDGKPLEPEVKQLIEELLREIN
jgi:hypothetical protein